MTTGTVITRVCAAAALAAAAGAPGGASAEDPRPRVEFYNLDGSRAAYGRPDQAVPGRVQLYDAKTSKRLGYIDGPASAVDARGNRVDGGALGLAPLKTPPTKGGK